MIRTIETLRGNDFPGQRTEAALHTIADDRPANLLGDGEADPPGDIAVLTIADKKDEAGGCRAPAGVRSKVIRPLGKGD